jgi:hypothetical protein
MKKIGINIGDYTSIEYLEMYYSLRGRSITCTDFSPSFSGMNVRHMMFKIINVSTEGRELRFDLSNETGSAIIYIEN